MEQTETTQPNQDAFVDDFRTELLSQDSDEPETKVEDIQTLEQGNQLQAVNPTETNKLVNETNKETPKETPDPLFSELMTADGSLDANKFTSFFGEKEPDWKPIDYDPVDATLALSQKKEDDSVPVYMREIEERRKYRTNLESKMVMPLDLYNQARQQGYSEQDAFAMAQGKVKEFLSSHFEEREAKLSYERQQQALKGQQDEAEAAALKPKADAVFNQVSMEFGGAEKARQLLLNQKYGGDFLLKLFHLQNPNVKYKEQKEYAAAIDTWFLKNIQSSPDNLRWALDIAQARFLKANKKHIYSYMQKHAANSGLSAQAAQTQVKTRTANITTKQQINDLDRYMGVESQDTEI